jgi:pyridoxamine 5'-phosphate oxidase
VNSILPPWRSSVARALHRNRSLPYARYVQLATIDRTNRPRNRTVVFRGWREPESQLQFAIDLRSAKAQDLRTDLDNWAEVCWYFPKTREQFRINGELLLVTAESPLERDCKARQAAWQQLSDAGRISFAWAMPGADRSTDPAAFDPPAPDVKQPLTNFGLLLLAPTAVDHLELRGEPQNRCIYELVEAEWVVREINP